LRKNLFFIFLLLASLFVVACDFGVNEPSGAKDLKQDVLKVSDYKEEIVWEGKVLDLYPMGMEYDKKTANLKYKSKKTTKRGYVFKYPKANNIEVTKDGQSLWKITTGAVPYQVGDLRETEEWAYISNGYRTDSIEAKGSLVLKGQHICIADDKEVKGSGLSRKTVWNNCLYYPQKYINTSIPKKIYYYDLNNLSQEYYIQNWSLQPSTNITINKNKATVTYHTPYDPLTSNYTEGLVSCWTFDSDGNDILGDYNLSLTGDYTFNSTSIKGNSLFLDGNGDYGTTSNVPLGDYGTISGWLYIDNLNFRYIFDSNGNRYLTFIDTTGDIQTFLSGQNMGVFNTYISAKTWTHFSIVYNSSASTKLITYKNGVRVANSTTSFTSTSPSTFYLGTKQDISEFWHGNIDEFVVWNKVLNDTQINELYNSGTGVSCQDIIDSGTANDTDTCTYTSGNWDVDCSDNCEITSNVDVTGNNITITGTGTFTTTANITGWTNTKIQGTDSSNKCFVRCESGGCFKQ